MRIGNLVNMFVPEIVSELVANTVNNSISSFASNAMQSGVSGAVNAARHQMPGLFGLSPDDEALWSTLLTAVKDQEPEAWELLTELLTKLTMDERNRLRIYVTSVKLDRLCTHVRDLAKSQTKTKRDVRKDGSTHEDSVYEMIYEMRKHDVDPLSADDPRVKFLVYLARQVKDKDTHSTVEFLRKCFLGEETFLKKLKDIALDALRYGGKAFDALYVFAARAVLGSAEVDRILSGRASPETKARRLALALQQRADKAAHDRRKRRTPLAPGFAHYRFPVALATAGVTIAVCAMLI